MSHMKHLSIKINYVLFLATLICSQIGHAQVRLTDLLKESYKSEKELIIRDQSILFDSEDPSDYETLNEFPKDSIGRIIIPFTVKFYNCTFPEYLLLENFHFERSLKFFECTFEHAFGLWASKVDSLVSWNSKYREFYIEGIECNRFISNGDVVEDYMELYNNTFHQELEINTKSNSFDLNECTFSTPSPKVTLINEKLFYEANPAIVANVMVEANEIGINENKFYSESDYDLLIFNFKNAEEVNIARNELGGLLSLKGSTNFIKVFETN